MISVTPSNSLPRNFQSEKNDLDVESSQAFQLALGFVKCRPAEIFCSLDKFSAAALPPDVREVFDLPVGGLTDYGAVPNWWGIAPEEESDQLRKGTAFPHIGRQSRSEKVAIWVC
jgi:hypothetical protein